MLNQAGCGNVSIRSVSGNLTDHYDPRNNTLRLSDGVYGSSSVAAIGIAAHECGHAMQQHEGYAPLVLRSALDVYKRQHLYSAEGNGGRVRPSGRGNGNRAYRQGRHSRLHRLRLLPEGGSLRI